MVSLVRRYICHVQVYKAVLLVANMVGLCETFPMQSSFFLYRRLGASI